MELTTSWLLIGTVLALMPAGWFLLAPFGLGWQPLRDQIAQQVALSTALADECAGPFDRPTISF
ncbi:MULTISPECIES: hypothetical protein [Variovorax]|jgi:hypothetical protein|uniref:hypothetical protein n=1 Tax=Variovorax TaxID=34072 RepID=UPI00086CA2FD|nr:MULTISPECIES: hypothetical protein [Variovorax]MBN8751856.1 hypothetical protein [Variovorax sp.]ODU17679.1 MAG: hypothetical protein ABS94_07120 [Variovorax sp. SCN 67-85]ODV27036.1 MAG: hypothetical protein ABT25_02475 [Variovorax sp. SCN 67-20]OJZ09309.1 MAG: hypothetical protein BGP22_35990 [Variovorax sp. 67-131]UKI04887.1 hypothetical protein L3V85_18720 [Variovorax paradoxus]